MEEIRNTSLGVLVKTDDGSYTIQDSQTGECYHSRMGAQREAHELYIRLSGFLDALNQPKASPVTVLDVGLGLGYNAAATISAWFESTSPKSLYIVSLEKNESVIELFLSPSPPWAESWDPKLRSLLRSFVRLSSSQWRAEILHPKAQFSDTPNQDQRTLTWEIFSLDAANSDLPYKNKAPLKGYHNMSSCMLWDFIWQDPFSPQQNPEMWSPKWFQKLAEQSHPQTVLVTYSVARKVRDALESAGFFWEKHKTPFIMKKHWLKAMLRPATGH